MAGIAEGFARLNLLGLLVTWHVDWVDWLVLFLGLVVAGLLVRPGPDDLRPDHAGQRRDARRSRGDGVVPPISTASPRIVNGKVYIGSALSVRSGGENIGITSTKASITVDRSKGHG